METKPKILRDLENLLFWDPISLRRWYVESIILSPENQSMLEGVEIPFGLVEIAQGTQSPSPEHQGVAARIIYENIGDQISILDRLPTLSSPKTWNHGASMAHLILWLFEPWRQWRYDPRSETAWNALSNGQWSSHLKGKDTEDLTMDWLESTITQLSHFGFTNVIKAMTERGFASMDPTHYKMDASDFANNVQLAEAAFYKFCGRVSSRKEVMEHILRSGLMKMDTSTINCLTGLAAFGNGVVPTTDVYQGADVGDNYDAKRWISIPAGKLISSHIEFMLGSAGGLMWDEDPQFEEFVQFRADIHNGVNQINGWDDWVDGARQYSDILLRKKCPTYKSFLDHAFPTDESTPPIERDAFLRLLGAAVFGSNLKIVAAMIGAPNAGKDTVIKWLTFLLGNDQVGVLSPLALTAQADDQRAFAPLKGARLAVVSGEVGEGRNTAILAEKVKSITSGGGTLTVAEKYEKPTTIFFDGMLIMQGNSVPTIIGGDSALYRNRLVAVEFKHPFPLQANSFEKEYRREAPSFLQVLFLAYCDYVERGGGMSGIDPPDSWKNFSREVEQSADAFAIIDACITEPQDIEIPSPVFYKALSILAERHLGIRHPMSAGKWAARLKKAGVQIVKDQNTRYRTKVARADYKGWMFHFTLDADKSDGFFTQEDWTRALEDANVVYNS